MAKAVESVIFDMDGTLIDAREWHFRSLNEALQIFGEEISIEEHLSSFDGLPTSKKLEMLTERKGLPVSSYNSLIAQFIEDSLQFETPLGKLQIPDFP